MDNFTPNQKLLLTSLSSKSDDYILGQYDAYLDINDNISKKSCLYIENEAILDVLRYIIFDLRHLIKL